MAEQTNPPSQASKPPAPEGVSGWILFEDNHCLAFNKPAGTLTQGVPEGLPALEHIARDYLRHHYHKKGRVYLGIPHRLDRPVSGVVLFARSSKAAARLAEQFRDRQVTKIYQAWLAHPLDLELPDEDTWTDFIRKVPDEARGEVCAQDTPGAKQAITRMQVMLRLPGRTLVELEPETGRMHQLRLQASLRGAPIVGDTLYGGISLEGPHSQPAIALHARSLTFLHPIRYGPITLTAPYPQHFPPPA
jgi:23S rRNA pseudouridine1911/1915/1917 synthase